MPSLSTTQSHAEAYASTGTSPPESWEHRVSAWCWACASVEELAFMVRSADANELAIAMAVIREHKGWPVAEAVAGCL